MQILRRFVFLLLFNHILTSNVFATWVAVIQLKGNDFDHIHVTIAKDKDFADAAMLNIWNNAPHVTTDFGNEIKRARKFIVFYHPKSFDAVLSEWSQFYIKLKPKRLLLSKNCAFATKTFLTQNLNLNIKNNWVVPHVWRIIYLPNRGSGIPLPDAIRLRIKKALKKSKILFYTEQQLKDKPIENFLLELKDLEQS